MHIFLLCTVFFQDLAPYEASCAKAGRRIRKMETFPRSVPARVPGSNVMSIIAIHYKKLSKQKHHKNDFLNCARYGGLNACTLAHDAS